MARFLRSFLLLYIALALYVSRGVAATVRLEETDASITYSGDWYTNGSPANSGGGAVLTNLKGSRATVGFTGTAITWIGVTDPWSGLATVYLDGTPNTIDTWGNPTRYQQVLFTARGLEPGPHTLTIEITHTRHPGGLGSWVWIDSFDIENGSGVTGRLIAPEGRIEQNNPALIYSGTWYLNTNPAMSGGTAVLSTTAGSRAVINFNGTGIKWIAYRDDWSGIAKVYLDGELKATVDTYLTPARAQQVAYAIDGLALGAHTLTIEVTGARNDESSGAWIWVDAFDVTASGGTSGSP